VVNVRGGQSVLILRVREGVCAFPYDVSLNRESGWATAWQVVPIPVNVKNRIQYPAEARGSRLRRQTPIISYGSPSHAGFEGESDAR